MIVQIWKEWRKWHKSWDSLCNRCGKCCYTRSVSPSGKVIIHYDKPCENLNLETHLCNIFYDRFRKCNHCGKVGLFTALFNPSLPHDCAYVQTFRLWKKES